MKTTNILVSLLFFSLFSFNTVHAEQCFPQGSITVSLPGSTGQTAHAEVSPMGAITIDYPNGPLRGYVDSLGHFTASNDYTTVNGNVDTSCAKVQSSSIDTQGCLVPVTKDCDANALGGISVQQNMFGIGNTAMGTGAIQACKDTHTQYQSELNAYKTCLNTKSQSAQSVSNNTPTPTESVKAKASCQEQHGIHSVTQGNYCSCPLVGYSFDSNGQCISDIQEGSTTQRDESVSLETSDILKAVGKIFQTFYPNGVDTLNKGIANYKSGQKEDAIKSFTQIQPLFNDARKNALGLNDKYKDKKISEQATNLLYSLKETSIVCDLTVTIMMSGDTQGVGVTSGIKKCLGWVASTNNLIGTTTMSSIKNISSSMSTLKVDNNFNRTLKKGMSGEDVKQLQVLLQKLNYLPSTQVLSTYFGVITNNALIKFQKDNKILPATGSFGPATQAKLISLTK